MFDRHAGPLYIGRIKVDFLILQEGRGDPSDNAAGLYLVFILPDEVRQVLGK